MRKTVGVLGRSVPLTMLNGSVFRGATLYALENIADHISMIVPKTHLSYAVDDAEEVSLSGKTERFITMMGLNSSGLHTEVVVWERDWDKLVMVIDGPMEMCHVTRWLAMQFQIDPGATAPGWRMNPGGNGVWDLIGLGGEKASFVSSRNPPCTIQMERDAWALAHVCRAHMGNRVQDMYAYVAREGLANAGITSPDEEMLRSADGMINHILFCLENNLPIANYRAGIFRPLKTKDHYESFVNTVMTLL